MKQFYKIITILLCIVLLTACGGKAVDLNENININSTISVDENSIQETISSSANEKVALQENTSPLDMAKAGNPDTVAWLRIPNTDIDNPIMQSLTMRTIKGEMKMVNTIFGAAILRVTTATLQAKTVCFKTQLSTDIVKAVKIQTANDLHSSFAIWI